MNIAVADDRAANRGPIVSNGPGGHPGGRPSRDHGETGDAKQGLRPWMPMRRIRSAALCH